MSHAHFLQILDEHSLAAAAFPGAWLLPAGRALTIEPIRQGILRVERGRLWVTCNGARNGAPDRFGDRFLARGDSARFEPGHRVVVESCDRAAAMFSWTAP